MCFSVLFPASAVTPVVAFLVAALAASGCGETPPAMVPVTGRVLRKGEIPIMAGSIYFHPAAGNAYKDDVPSGMIQSDGQFEMKTFPFGKGVPPGAYKVTLAGEIASRSGRPELADASKTPWTIDVAEPGVAGQVFRLDE